MNNQPFTGTVGFVGAGRMASALAAGFVKQQIVAPHQILVCDPNPAAIDAFQELIPGVHVHDTNGAVAEKTNYLFLAVKPQMITAALDDVSLTGKQVCLVSVVAGVSLARLQQLTGATHVIRVMPNMPVLVGQGALGLAPSDRTSTSHMSLITHWLRAVGNTYHVPESLMDAVTGLSGSGPAFVLSFVQALIDGGVLSGLSRDLARSLTLDTIRGTIEMLQQTNAHPIELRDQVGSPAGTTLHGLKSMAEHGFEAAVISAVYSAANRAHDIAAWASDKAR
jgi:pyrroline-5-carboxylate reductase